MAKQTMQMRQWSKGASAPGVAESDCHSDFFQLRAISFFFKLIRPTFKTSFPLTFIHPIMHK